MPATFEGHSSDREGNQDTSILQRIREALEAAAASLSALDLEHVASTEKPLGRGPVTEADHAINRVLREMLPRGGEGWLSEESVDDLSRLDKSHLWIVDPLDGTLEFIAGIPEWSISVGWIEGGRAVAGGIYNPVTRELFLGSRAVDVTYNGKPVRASDRATLADALVLASRSEHQRGDWDAFKAGPFNVRAKGSVAYKLALVAAGLADATWTLSAKSEWDIAAGVALVEAAGGFVSELGGEPITFNHQHPVLSGLIAGGPRLQEEIHSVVSRYLAGAPLPNPSLRS
jgi:myo-inositol-1(or 4)-monophosphatase